MNKLLAAGGATITFINIFIFTVNARADDLCDMLSDCGSTETNFGSFSSNGASTPGTTAGQNNPNCNSTLFQTNTELFGDNPSPCGTGMSAGLGTLSSLGTLGAYENY